MMQEQQDERTPLQSVKECCRRLKQEWEDTIRNTEIISSEVLSSLKLQEAALTLEQKQVQSLKQETYNLRRSVSQKTQEQDEKALAERTVAYQMKVNIHSQLGEVKQLQYQLAKQLANLRVSMGKIKSSKQLESADSLLPPSTSEHHNGVSDQPVVLLDLQTVRPLEDRDSSVQSLLAASPTAHPDSFVLDSDSNSPSLIDMKAKAITLQKVLKQNHPKPEFEVLEEGGYTHCKEHLESRIKPASSLSLVSCNGLDRFQVDHVSVKREYDEKADDFVKDRSLRKLSCDPACNAFSPQDSMDELDNILLSERLEIQLRKIHEKRSTKEENGGIPDVKIFKKKRLMGSNRNSAGKRKWEVPIEIALEEDAPGLLEKLQERGLLKDIVIYSAFVEDEYENGDGHFKDLECIVRKIWGSPTGLFKQPAGIRHVSGLVGKDPMYCLSCLVSLIDQAKSMSQRKWPVEWGWCRELQAFVFVFDKHNRVILERPEYGNATYFFELVQFLPVKWQVLRLIHVLNVTALGKTALLENKPLEVGYELTADESKILEGFGWAPGTGLGTFLNFCDRVIHDVKEDDNFEWRQKIGKCLMDGYDRGRIMTPTLPSILKGLDIAKFEVGLKPSTVLST